MFMLDSNFFGFVFFVVIVLLGLHVFAFYSTMRSLCPRGYMQTHDNIMHCFFFLVWMKVPFGAQSCLRMFCMFQKNFSLMS